MPKVDWTDLLAVDDGVRVSSGCTADDIEHREDALVPQIVATVIDAGPAGNDRGT